ncbi:MAG: hypothetical protein ABR570_03820 [Burkholderiales bacterium]
MPTYFIVFFTGLSFCAAALAQSTGDGARGSTPPGMSHDGAAPADGAIKGGSAIAPGESGGLPGRKAPTGAAGTTNGERLARCDELTGVLRDDCLRKDRTAAGGSSAPGERDRDDDERDLK